jgi:type VI protein secretion system component Hcp
MTRQPENKENAEPKISKDELSEKELEKASGGIHITKSIDKASPLLFTEACSGPPSK